MAHRPAFDNLHEIAQPGGVAFVLVWAILQGRSDIENIHRMAELGFLVTWGLLVWVRERGFLREIRAMMVNA